MFYKILTVICTLQIIVESTERDRGIEIKNHAHERLWVKLTGLDGVSLYPGLPAPALLPSNWSGRVYARSNGCKTEACNATYSEAVFQFQENGQNHYHVSLMHGFSVPIRIEPTDPDTNCKQAVCLADINSRCPESHWVKNDEGVVVACKYSKDLFESLCPKAVTSESKARSNTYTCSSHLYTVHLGVDDHEL